MSTEEISMTPISDALTPDPDGAASSKDEDYSSVPMPPWWKLLSYLLLEGAEIAFSPGGEGSPDVIELRISNLMLGRERSGDVVVDQLELRVAGPGLGQGATNGSDLSVRVSRLGIIVTDSYVNHLLDQFKDELAAQGVTDVKVAFIPGGVSLHGTVHKFIAFSFIVDVGLSVVDNHIRVTWDDFWMADRVRLPDFMRHLLWTIIRSRVKSEGPLSWRGQDLMIDPFYQMPIALDTELRSIDSGQGVLVLRAGIQAPEPIAENVVSPPSTEPE